MLKTTLLASFLLAACGKLATHHPATPASLPARVELAAVYDQRLTDFQAKTKDHGGWPSATDCDGAVWMGVACLGGVPVNYALAEQAPGEIHRRPKSSGECYPTASSSTASRDGLTLYAACAFRHADAGALNRVLAYSDAHDGYIGQPADPNLTLLGPNLEGIMARGAAKIGPPARADTILPVVEAPGIKDFQRHIEVQEVLFSTAVQGAATGWELELMKTLVAEAPSDALFQAALGVYSGDCTTAPTLLVGTPKTPSYVRGDQAALFAEAWWLEAANLVLSHCKEP